MITENWSAVGFLAIMMEEKPIHARKIAIKAREQGKMIKLKANLWNLWLSLEEKKSEQVLGSYVGYKNLSRIKSKVNVCFSRILSEENGCKKLIIDSLLETKIEGKLIQTKKIAIKACE